MRRGTTAAPRKRSLLRRAAYNIVSWSGLLLIGVIAVPAAVLVVGIFTIQEAMDVILKKINRE